MLYSQLFRASIPFDDFLKEDGVWKGYVRLKDFSLEMLSDENSNELNVITDGILDRKPFIRNI